MRRLDYHAKEWTRLSAAVSELKSEVRALRDLANPPRTIRIDVPRRDGPAGGEEVDRSNSDECCLPLGGGDNKGSKGFSTPPPNIEEKK